MNVVLFGASGMIGSRVLHELLERGHSVTAVSRNPEKIVAPPARAVKGDVTDEAAVSTLARGADAAISAYAPPKESVETLQPATRALIAGLTKAGVRRLLVVGGAGSLEVAPGLQLVDTPTFPIEWKPIALAHRAILPLLRASTLDWTCLSPAALIQPGSRTGKFRLGGTKLVTDAKGESRISAEDYAVALVDELERPVHVRQQFSVAY
jgi:putative NADH-flavin reductase